MGNSSSKAAKTKSKKQQPTFSRTDTQGSTRSLKSFHSRRSVQSEADSFKSALSAAPTDNYESSKSIDKPSRQAPPSALLLPTSTMQDISTQDLPLTPGPSILAPPIEPNNATELFPATYQGNTDSDNNNSNNSTTHTNSANINGTNGSSNEARPYHRRTYSSSSIINGGVINDGSGYFSDSNNGNNNNNNSNNNNNNNNTSISTNDPLSDDAGQSHENLTLPLQESVKTSDDASTDTAETATTKASSISSVPGTPKTDDMSISGSIVTTMLTPAGTSPNNQFGSPMASPFARSERKLGLRSASFASSTGGNSGITLNIDEVIQRLLDAGYRGRTSKHVCLKNNEIALICQTAREIFLAQPIVLDLSPPVKVVGDVHGQYGDLIRMFDMCGFPPASNYLFLGDYVDRGKQSLETILLLLCYKIKYPENFFLLRGNHECANVTRVYGFYDECKRRCNIKTWKIFIDTFNTLPIAAIVAQKIFCVHGGLSPSLTNMNELRSIQRPTDVPDYGLLNDILWSDPADTENEWEDNERGVSYCFNKVAINKFLAKFGFDLVCRAHIVVEDGYEFFNDRTLVTVFSAPNYCGEFDNWGAVMSVSDDLLCSFELLKPLDSMALRQEMQRSRLERRANSMSSTIPAAQSV
ncbi:hypothetical protein D0Z00_001133 [Geotrichum galactomycetum]|uniref:Uncharacterized protein n=1 Tax=Geotrichum galactomycetum TaxID=27317 RepID=A0ACB6V7R6_9ASCO|nr:hypothetical protein D0Z00_001133 [Geotrichum candidum]